MIELKNFRSDCQHATIGFYRADGDIEVLATLNNSGAHLSDSEFDRIVNDLLTDLQRLTDMNDIEAFNFDAAVDVIDLSGNF